VAYADAEPGAAVVGRAGQDADAVAGHAADDNPRRAGGPRAKRSKILRIHWIWGAAVRRRAHRQQRPEMATRHAAHTESRAADTRRPLTGTVTSMTAQPARDADPDDPDDPVEILRVLPARFHEQFLDEYYQAAGEAARMVGGYRQLHDLLRLWRLTAAATADPGFDDRLAAAREAIAAGSKDGSATLAEVIAARARP
jgi:hypothetical protein